MAFRPVYSSSKQKLIGSYGRIRTPLFEQMCVDIGGDGSLSVPKLPRNINQVLSVLELGQIKNTNYCQIVGREELFEPR